MVNTMIKSFIPSFIELGTLDEEAELSITSIVPSNNIVFSYCATDDLRMILS